MKPRLIAASFGLALSLLAPPSSFAGEVSGIIHFTGTIVEPPCSFDLDAARTAPARVRPSCPRPAAGSVEFIDATTQQPLKTTQFTQLSRSIDLPNRPNASRSPMIAVITYQ